MVPSLAQSLFEYGKHSLAQQVPLGMHVRNVLEMKIGRVAQGQLVA